MQILSITNSYIKTLLRIPTKGPVDQDVITFLEVAFKSLACLNGSFLLDDDKHYYCTSRHHGVDMALAEDTFDLIGKIENESIQNLVSVVLLYHPDTEYIMIRNFNVCVMKTLQFVCRSCRNQTAPSV